MCVQQLLNSISNEFTEQEKRIKTLSDRNIALTKIIATIRLSLEKTLKNPELLNQSIYESIDLCRANFSYMNYSTGKVVTDPPLTEAEKTLA